MKFMDITEHGFTLEKKDIEIEPEAAEWGLNYRHMCSFWFVDFYHFVKDYDLLMRVDEDCFVDFSIDDAFKKLESTTFIMGALDGDLEKVTIGMNRFTLDFVDRNRDTYNFKKFSSKTPGGPYTNLIGLHLHKIRKNECLLKYVREIDESQMIYKRRWGDLPLWGEAIFYIFGEDDEGTRIVDKDLKYFHQSHGVQVN